MKRKNCIIIHGFGADKHSNFFPWLKSELENLDYKVYLENFPNTEYPKLEEWMKFCEKYCDILNEESIIVGHSLGGAFASLFMTKINIKIKGLFLVAPASYVVDENNEQNVQAVQNAFEKKDFDNLMEFFETKADWRKIKENNDFVKVYLGEDDNWVSVKSQKIYTKEKINVKVFKNKGHFLTFDFPELLEDIKNLDK